MRIKGANTGAISISNSRLVALTMFSITLPLARRMTVPYWFALPMAIAASDLLAAIPSCLEQHFVTYYPVQCFELPVALPTWSVAMAWSKLKDCDPANLWLRHMTQVASQDLTREMTHEPRSPRADSRLC